MGKGEKRKKFRKGKKKEWGRKWYLASSVVP
jgi:hypothetical protein